MDAGTQERKMTYLSTLVGNRPVKKVQMPVFMADHVEESAETLPLNLPKDFLPRCGGDHKNKLEHSVNLPARVPDRMATVGQQQSFACGGVR